MEWPSLCHELKQVHQLGLVRSVFEPPLAGVLCFDGYRLPSLNRIGIYERWVFEKLVASVVFAMQEEKHSSGLVDPVTKFSGKRPCYELGAKCFPGKIRKIETSAHAARGMTHEKLVRWWWYLAAGMVEFLASEPLLSKWLEIRSVSSKTGVNKAIGIYLVVKHHVKRHEEIGLACARKAKEYDSRVRRIAHIRPKAEKSRAGLRFRTTAGAGV